MDAMSKSPVKGDRCVTIQEDMKDLNITNKGCNETENYEHLNDCNKIFNNKGKINMQHLWNGNLIQMKECNITITRNINIREQIEEEYNNRK